MSIIFVFVDGIGLAPAGPDNPLSTAPSPTLRTLLGGPLSIEQAHHTGGPALESPEPLGARRALLFQPIDATLGVDGLPQSGTGQAALLAGFNAAQQHGRHQPHVPPVAQRQILAEQSIFRRVIAHGGRAVFANAFGEGYWQAVEARRVRRSATVIAAEGAGLKFRTIDDLRAGQALSWDVSGALLGFREQHVPEIEPRQAGANLARLAHSHELVFFETFLPDLAGHGRLWNKEDTWPVATQISWAIEQIDGLIAGLLEHMRPEDTLLLTSDHGNAESLAAPAHTRNPVPLLAIGPGVPAFAGVASIAEIADAIDRVTG